MAGGGCPAARRRDVGPAGHGPTELSQYGPAGGGGSRCRSHRQEFRDRSPGGRGQEGQSFRVAAVVPRSVLPGVPFHAERSRYRCRALGAGHPPFSGPDHADLCRRRAGFKRKRRASDTRSARNQRGRSGPGADRPTDDVARRARGGPPADQRPDPFRPRLQREQGGARNRAHRPEERPTRRSDSARTRQRPGHRSRSE